MPGFGAVVALVTLVVALLLAFGRDNNRNTRDRNRIKTIDSKIINSDNIKLVIGQLGISVALSLFTHGTRNDIESQVWSGIAMLIFLSLLGIAMSSYGLLSRNSNSNETSNIEIDRSLFKKFCFSLMLGIVGFCVLWGLTYLIVLTHITNLYAMIIVFFTGSIVSTYVIGYAIFSYTKRLFEKSI